MTLSRVVHLTVAIHSSSPSANQEQILTTAAFMVDRAVRGCQARSSSLNNSLSIAAQLLRERDWDRTCFGSRKDPLRVVHEISSPLGQSRSRMLKGDGFLVSGATLGADVTQADMVVKVFAEMHVEECLLTAYLSELTWSNKEGFSFVHLDRIEIPGFGRAIKFEGIVKDDGEYHPSMSKAICSASAWALSVSSESSMAIGRKLQGKLRISGDGSSSRRWLRWCRSARRMGNWRSMSICGMSSMSPTVYRRWFKGCTSLEYEDVVMFMWLSSLHNVYPSDGMLGVLFSEIFFIIRNKIC